MKDDLGKRIKENYENRTRFYLPRRTYTIIRLDGKAFHTFCKGLDKPFDSDMIDLISNTTSFLCSQIQGVVLGYCQSDEISLLLSDFETPTTQAWFDGNIQKIASISASLATYRFGEILRYKVYEKNMSKFLINAKYSTLKYIKPFAFDSRVFSIPDRTEVMNYFIWRQKDAMRNSVSMLAQSLYSHKQLNGKSIKDMKENCLRKGTNWDSLDRHLKVGTCVYKNEKIIKQSALGVEPVKRDYWFIDQQIPEFKVGEEFFENIIPKIT